MAQNPVPRTRRVVKTWVRINNLKPKPPNFFFSMIFLFYLNQIVGPKCNGVKKQGTTNPPRISRIPGEKPLSLSVICWKRVIPEQVVALVPWSEH
jgi:hypothetical protein